jgi:hypothetical protein
MTASTASPREADVTWRGIGTAAAPAAPAAAAAAARSSLAADTPVGGTAAREAMRLAVADAVTRGARERLADLRPLGVAGAVAASAAPLGDPVDAPSPELVRRLTHLRSTVSRYARERREAGVPVERVIPEVKGLVREAASGEGWVDPAETLMAEVVRWAITAYYDEPELAHVPRFY